MEMGYLQNSIAPKWNIYVSFVLKGRLCFTRVSTKPCQIYIYIYIYTCGIAQSSFRANGSSNGKSCKKQCQDVPGLVLRLVEATKVLEEATVAFAFVFAFVGQVHAKLLVVNFAFVLASFQNAKPDGKTKPPDEKNTCRRKAETWQNVNAAGGKTR